MLRVRCAPSRGARSAFVRILMSGGGTAGHVYPALTVAEQFAAAPDEVVFVGTPDGLEARIVPEAGVAFRPLAAAGLRSRLARGRSSRRRCASLCRPCVPGAGSVPRGPMWSLGFGGYVSIPVGFAAALRRVPLVLHEQNSVPGIANRVLSRFAAAVAVTYEESAAPHRAPRPRRRDRQSGSRGGARRGPARLAASRWRCRPTRRCCWSSAAAEARGTSTPRSLALRDRLLDDPGLSGHPRRRQGRGVRRVEPRSTRPVVTPAAAGACSTTSTTWGRRWPRPTWWSRVPAPRRSPRSPRWGSRRCSCRIRTRPTTTRPRTPRASWRTARRSSSPTPELDGQRFGDVVVGAARRRRRACYHVCRVPRARTARRSCRMSPNSHARLPLEPRARPRSPAKTSEDSLPDQVYAHFIGAGGAGMSGIALVLAERGLASPAAT